MVDIKVFPIFDSFYYSFYVEGLQRNKVKFVYTRDGFPVALDTHNHFTMIIDSNPKVKVFIDASDRASFASKGLDWCDIYAKVNIDEASVPVQYQQKIIPIGPSFAVKAWNSHQALILATKQFIMNRDIISNPREHFACYWRQWRYRLPESAYTPGNSRNNYIFFAGSLWKKEFETNKYRANFIRVCSSLEHITFEGGFSPRTKSDIQGFESLTMSQRIKFTEYLKKLKASLVAFNTPAVEGCHGWKLGEFLALGKAIISTPLTRALPSPLQHGVHIHYVDGSPESIHQAILKIAQDHSYREKLEKNAREYYLSFLQPSQVIKRILSRSGF